MEQGTSQARVPNTSSKPPGFVATALAVSRAVEESKDGISFVVDMSWDLVEASWRAMTADQDYPLDPNEVQTFRLTFERLPAEWNRGYPELRFVQVSLAPL